MSEDTENKYGLNTDLYVRLLDALKIEIESLCDSMKNDPFYFMEDFIDGKIKVPSSLTKLAKLVSDADKLLDKANNLIQRKEI